MIGVIFAALPTTLIGIALFLYKLEPELRQAIVSLVNALRAGDDEEARKAYEAARRIAFAARQR